MLKIKTHEDFEAVRRAVEDNGFPKDYKWTPLYLGIKHLIPSSKPILRSHWASVQKCGELFYNCKLFYPVGCQRFHSRDFDTQEEAMAFGEKFILEHANEA